MQFTDANHISIAAALTSYNKRESDEQDPRYATLKFSHYGWGEETSKFDVQIPQHRCSHEELGINATEGH
jgi:hypothetical protein